MGAGNVKAAGVTWSHLPDPAFRVLLCMALVSLDTDERPMFWGGRESIALWMGRKAPHTDADYRAVSRAVRHLVKAGAIRVDRGPSPVSNARYELLLSPWSRDAGRPPIAGRRASSEQATPGDGIRRRPATEQATPGDRTGDARRHPEEEQDSPRLISGRTEQLSSTTPDRASFVGIGESA